VRASQAHTLDSLRIGSLIALGLITILAFGPSWWMAGRALRPVHRITDAARTLSERTLDARINLRGPNDELKELADTFDAMLDRLEGAFDSQRRFVANASHELRTPLATERVLIDEALASRSAGPEELRSILQELRTNSEDTERLIDALLTLARSQRGLERWTAVDLSEVARSVVEQAAPAAALAALTLETDLRPVSVSGDPGLLERLAGNLVDNAIRHNLSGGTVFVSTRQEAGTGLLEVANTGPAVDPATVTALIEPFRRAGPDRVADNGIGLGLSIVDAVVTAHRGRLHLTARPDGGLVVHVRLPLGDASTDIPVR
jgi:signal transduction histidine kinase